MMIAFWEEMWYCCNGGAAMDILDVLIDKFRVDSDKILFSNADYAKAMSDLEKFYNEKMSEEQVAELEKIVLQLTESLFREGVRAGMKLGAQIAEGLLRE